MRRWLARGVGRVVAAGLLAVASVAARHLHHWDDTDA